MRSVLRSIAVFTLLASLGSAFAHAETDVDIELFLAVDVSRSMNPRELEIQRRGYAEALTHPDVIKAIQGGWIGLAAITYVEWAGAGSQRVVVDWTLVKDAADAAAIASRLTTHFVNTMRRTSISSVLDYASASFEDNGFRGTRRVIDVSGDGPNNSGRPVHYARDDATARGIIINGLPLMTREGMGSRWHIEELDQYYFDCVIGGPGAFVIPVLEWQHFPEAVRRKLVLELAMPLLPTPVRSKPPQSLFHRAQDNTFDCLIGEKIWDSIMGGYP